MIGEVDDLAPSPTNWSGLVPGFLPDRISRLHLVHLSVISHAVTK